MVNGAFNFDPNAYSLYMLYTAAHEGETGVDRSNTADFTQNPVPAGNHIQLALSRSKHATYTFNPNFYPIIDPLIILSTLSSLDFAYAVGAIDDITYLIAIYAANDLFYGCVVERFSDQGGRYADTRINVGEPNAPINGSAFIQDNQYGLYGKLVNGTFVF